VAVALGAVSCGAAPAGELNGTPAPDEPLPRSADLLAARLAGVDAALRRSVDAWGGKGAPPKDVALDALYEQRAYRLLATRPRLARSTLARLPRRLAPNARDSVTALRDLFRLAPPPRRRRFRTGSVLPANRLLGHYRAAERRFDVNWRVLAAVNLVETDFNRLRNSSSSGAQGPMQFLPSTWRRYGLGGDIHDPHDAILGAANYLCRSGAPGNYRRALFAYNPSTLYVDAVLRYARRMAGRGFLIFYNWQVFVRTPSGERRLTGPGRR